MSLGLGGLFWLCTHRATLLFLSFPSTFWTQEHCLFYWFCLSVSLAGHEFPEASHCVLFLSESWSSPVLSLYRGLYEVWRRCSLEEWNKHWTGSTFGRVVWYWAGHFPSLLDPHLLLFECLHFSKIHVETIPNATVLRGGAFWSD